MECGPRTKEMRESDRGKEIEIEEKKNPIQRERD